MNNSKDSTLTVSWSNTSTQGFTHLVEKYPNLTENYGKFILKFWDNLSGGQVLKNLSDMP